MVEVTHKELGWAIDECRENQVSIYVEGPSGIGKSEKIWAQAAERAKKLERTMRDWNSFTVEEKEKLASDAEYNKQFHIVADLRGATMTETDLAGLPDFTKNKEFVEFKPRLLAKALSMSEATGDLIFDEVNQAPRNVQNSLFKTFLDRSIGDVRVNDNILIIAAGNRVEDRASITEMSGPLGTRFMQFSLRCPTADEYIDYNLNSPYPHPTITGFLKSYNDQVFTFQPNSKEKAFANPRSIQRLAKLIFDKPMNSDADLKKIEILAKASCGEPWGAKFIAYSRMARKVDVDGILANPETVKKHVGQLDLKYSIISAIAYKCRDKFKDTIENALMVLNFLDEESGVFGLRVIKQYAGEAKLKAHLKKSDVWDKVLAGRFGPYLGFNENE
jgi:hypothetical protein